MVQKQRNISSKGLVLAGLVWMNALILNAAIAESREYYRALFASLPLLAIMVGACIAK